LLEGLPRLGRRESVRGLELGGVAARVHVKGFDEAGEEAEIGGEDEMDGVGFGMSGGLVA
jgi:hypothetical protein